MVTHVEIVELLINNGKINAKDNNGKTALMSAAKNDSGEVVQLLINNGADAKAKNNNGETALMLAAKCGYDEIVQLLINNGAKINAKDNYGYTPLICAARNGYIETAQLLIDKGADIKAKSTFGTALDCAKRNHCENIVAILTNHRDTCVVCYNNFVEVVIVPCGHYVLCRTCSKEVNKCPICRTTKDQAVLVYGV